MQDATFITAQGLKTALTFLNNIKTELENPSTQKVVFLKSRSLPSSPTDTLSTTLNTVESFLVAQAVTAINDQINALNDAFTELQDAGGSGS